MENLFDTEGKRRKDFYLWTSGGSTLQRGFEGAFPIQQEQRTVHNSARPKDFKAAPGWEGQ